MRRTIWLFPICLALSLSTAGGLGAGEDAFDKGEKALSARDYESAVALFEEGLTGDPDSLRLGSEYRQATIRKAIAGHPKEGAPADYDREIAFFEKLTTAYPKAAYAFLNYGFSYVDKIPAAGSVTQVILASKAQGCFTKSIEVKPTWIALYSRGNSYLYWPKIFGRWPLAVADLERAFAMQKAETRKSYHVRTYISLGDAYWRTDEAEKARRIWKEGIAEFPDNRQLRERMSRDGDVLSDYISELHDPNKRVDTDFRELWTSL